MDKLKQFINNNREEFDEQELPFGHELRFQKKLPHRKNKTKVFCLYASLIAASVALLIMLALPFYKPESSFLEHRTSCRTEDEINELRLYYSMQMLDIVDRIKEFDPGEKEQEKQQVLNETEQVLALSKQFDETVIPHLPCSDEGLFAVNQYYSTSLRSLNFMLEQLEEKQIDS